MKNLLLIFFIIALKGVDAQYLDTLHEVFNHKSSIDARLESRYSFINNQFTSVTGFRLGVAFQRKLRLGGGVSWLKTDYSKVFYEPGVSELDPPSIKFLKFGYVCFYADFVFHKTKRWQLSVPIQAGFGLTWYQRKLYYDLSNENKKYLLLLYEPGITAQFKVFKWFGLGSDVAYRFALKNNKKISEHLNSPTYSLKILVWFDQLYYLAFPNSKFTKKKGPAVW